MESIKSKLVELGVGTSSNPANFIIQGGYFEANSGIDSFSKQSLLKATELGHHLASLSSKNSVHYGILINDLGQQCSETFCELTTQPGAKKQSIKDLIDLAKQLAEGTGISPQKLTVSTEKHMKNRGLRKMKRILNSEDYARNIYPWLSREEIPGIGERWYLLSELGSDILLFESRGLSWVAKCPVIMGAYYAEMLSLIKVLNKNTSVPSVVIDFCLFNDKDKVLKGAETALKSFNMGHPDQMPYIVPILCDSECSRLFTMSISHEDFN